MRTVDFTDRLIKGQIAETVFEQMLRATKKFTVLSFGYEKILPEIIRMNDMNFDDETYKTIRRAPDFAVIDNVTKNVSLIEVKYRRIYTREAISIIAKKIDESWNPSFLFLATQNGFYYGNVQEIIKNSGEINPLPDEMISKKSQNEYLKLIHKFERSEKLSSF